MDNYKSGTNVLWLVGCNVGNWNLDAWEDGCTIFTTADLKAIDTKIDNGKPLSGVFMGFGAHGSSNGTHCLLNALSSGTKYTATYDTSYTYTACQAAYVVD